MYLYTHFFVLRGDIFLFLSIPCVCVCFLVFSISWGHNWALLFVVLGFSWGGAVFFATFLNELNGLRGGLDCTYLDMNTPSLPPL